MRQKFYITPLVATMFPETWSCHTEPLVWDGQAWVCARSGLSRLVCTTTTADGPDTPTAPESGLSISSALQQGGQNMET